MSIDWLEIDKTDGAAPADLRSLVAEMARLPSSIELDTLLTSITPNSGSAARSNPPTCYGGFSVLCTLKRSNSELENGHHTHPVHHPRLQFRETTLHSLRHRNPRQLPSRRNAHCRHPLSLPLTALILQNKSISSLLTYLRAIRRPYLSYAPPPRRSQQQRRSTEQVPDYLDDEQREDIDAQTSQFLREINGNITDLTSAVSIHHDTATKVLEKKYGKPSGLLWRWAGGTDADADAGKSEQQLDDEGRLKTLKSFRDGVLWYLNNRLNRVVITQQEMVGIRLDRERERQKSILYDARNKDVRLSIYETDYGDVDLRGHDTFPDNGYNPTLDDQQTEGQELSPEQMQLFERENHELFDHLNSQLDKVQQAEKSLIEISELQSTLVGHLSVQGEMIGQLVDDAGKTDENVRRGNKELQKASERGSVAQMVFYGTASLCGFLVVWDLIF
jgi:syntaxin 18